MGLISGNVPTGRVKSILLRYAQKNEENYRRDVEGGAQHERHLVGSGQVPDQARQKRPDGGGTTREQKLSIMRDSQIGSYGVMALLFSFGLRWAALTEITEIGIDAAIYALIAAAAASRAALPGIMHYIPVAREDGLSAGAGKPSFDRAAIAFLIGVAFLLFLLGFRTSIVSLGLAVLVTGLFIYFVATRIGGQTGDVLGASQQVAETTILLAIVMVGLE